MNKIENLIAKTKKEFDAKENEAIKCYISFLREVSKHYLKLGAKVFFHENKVVHYGEGGFGRLVIEHEKDESDLFDDYHFQIKFLSKAHETILNGYIKITLKNLTAIRYSL